MAPEAQEIAQNGLVAKGESAGSAAAAIPSPSSPRVTRVLSVGAPARRLSSKPSFAYILLR
jgi:hypothetical protein